MGENWLFYFVCDKYVLGFTVFMKCVCVCVCLCVYVFMK